MTSNKNITLKVKDYDKSVHFTELELKRLIVGYLTVYRETGWRTLRSGKTETALRSLHAAAAAYPSDVRTLVGRGIGRSRKNLFAGAQKDAEEVLMENEFNKEAILLQAHCQFGLGNFEEALLMFRRGINKRGMRREFWEGRQAVEATLENSVGRHAGPMLTDLQIAVRTMSRKERIKQRAKAKVAPHHRNQDCLAKLDHQPKYNCSREEWLRLQQKRKGREKRIASVYLERMADDLHWCESLMTADNQPRQTDVKLNHLAHEAFQEADDLLTILRARKPLYHFNYKFEPCKTVYNRERVKLQGRRHKILEDNIKREFANLKQFQELNKTQKCIDQALKLKVLFEKLPEYLNSKKNEYLNNMSEILALVFLNEISRLAQLPEKEIRRTMNLRLGLDPISAKLTIDVIAQSTDFPFFDHISWRKTCKGFLATTENYLELAWLHYEVARTYLAAKKWDHLIAEANKALLWARKCGNLAWELNSMFFLAIGESQRRERDDARDILKEAIEIAAKLHQEDSIKIMLLAMDELGKKDNVSSGMADNIIRRREDTIVKLQEDVSKKERVRDLLSRIRFLPAERQLGLVPGIHSTASKLKSVNKSIIPGGTGGRLGLHPITKRTYYEFLEMTDPTLKE